MLVASQVGARRTGAEPRIDCFITLIYTIASLTYTIVFLDLDVIQAVHQEDPGGHCHDDI